MAFFAVASSRALGTKSMKADDKKLALLLVHIRDDSVIWEQWKFVWNKFVGGLGVEELRCPCMQIRHPENIFDITVM